MQILKHTAITPSAFVSNGIDGLNILAVIGSIRLRNEDRAPSLVFLEIFIIYRSISAQL